MKFIQSSKRARLGKLTATGLLASSIGLMATGSNAMFEDLKVAETGPHSTFHYELTRLLARATGFSQADSELIGVAAEVTDRMFFTGTAEGSPTIQLTGTERMDATKGAYFHWPRRNVNNATGEYQQPGGRDTCVFFTTTDKCVGGSGEVNAIELWAVSNSATPAVGVPSAAINGGASTPVQGGSLVALGIYLHAVADTYTHEPCMKKRKVRTHMGISSLVPECSVQRWHDDEEFGPESTNIGTKFTKEGGLAVWKALLNYRQKNGLSSSAIWTESQAVSVIKTYSEMEEETDRAAYAQGLYDDLN